MHFYIPGVVHVVMTSEAWKLFCILPKWAVWCTVYNAEPKISYTEKERVQPPSQVERIQLFSDRTDSDFAFRNLESLV